MDRKMGGKPMRRIPSTVKLYGEVKIGEKVRIGDYAIIGLGADLIEFSNKSETTITVIGDECIIGSHVIINRGTIIGNKTRIEDFCRIGENVKIGENCYIIYGAKIYDDVEIGKNSIIGGFVSERVKIGNCVRMFGELIHVHREPNLGWDDVIEESPIIEDRVFIGFGAKIIGGIRIGRNSYIAAGAVVTRDVPPKSIVTGINNIVPYTEWKGELKNSRFFVGDIECK